MHGVFGAGAAQVGVDKTASLPDEMLQHIASFLDSADWMKMLGISKRWQMALLAGLKVPKHDAARDCLSQSDWFQKITLELTQIGCSAKAVEVAKRLHFGWQQAESFFVISRELARQGETEKALQIANEIVEETLMDVDSREISKKLRDLRAGAFEVISQTLIQTDIDQALEVANRIEHRKHCTSRAFVCIVGRLLKNGDIARAKIIAEQIPIKVQKNFSLKNVAKAEANRGSTAL